MYASSVNVYLPKDRVTNMHQQYGFVEYRGEEDADYVSCCVYKLVGPDFTIQVIAYHLQREALHSLSSCAYHAF